MIALTVSRRDSDAGSWLDSLAARIGLGLLGVVVLFVAWALIANWLKETTPLAGLLAPEKTLHSFYRLIVTGEVTNDVGASLRRVLVSLVAALAIGVPVGILVGLSRYFDSASSGAFQFLRMISPLSWMPIAVMAFGIGDAPIYFLLTITAIWPIILNTSAGVRQLSPRWLALAHSLSATRGEVLRRIIIPGILGHVLTGTRVAIGMIWILLIPCEMLGVSSGLGYFILDTRDRLAYSELMAVILMIGIIGFMMDAAAKWLQSRWVHSSAD